VCGSSRAADAAPAPDYAPFELPDYAPFEVPDYAPFEVPDYAPFELPAFEPWPALVMLDAREVARTARELRARLAEVRTGKVDALTALQAAAESVGELAATALSQLNLDEADELTR